MLAKLGKSTYDVAIKIISDIGSATVKKMLGLYKSNVQSIFDHHEPSRDHRAIPGHQQVRRQPAPNARSFSGLPGSRGAQRRCRTRVGNDALGKREGSFDTKLAL
jgi:hypothetical protein